MDQEKHNQVQQEPANDSRHAAVTGQPSIFKRARLLRSTRQMSDIRKLIAG